MLFGFVPIWVLFLWTKARHPFSGCRVSCSSDKAQLLWYGSQRRGGFSTESGGEVSSVQIRGFLLPCSMQGANTAWLLPNKPRKGTGNLQKTQLLFPYAPVSRWYLVVPGANCPRRLVSHCRVGLPHRKMTLRCPRNVPPTTVGAACCAMLDKAEPAWPVSWQCTHHGLLCGSNLEVQSRQLALNIIIAQRRRNSIDSNVFNMELNFTHCPPCLRYKQAFLEHPQFLTPLNHKYVYCGQW